MPGGWTLLPWFWLIQDPVCVRKYTSYFLVLPVVFSLLLISGVFMPLFFGACLTCAVLCVMGYTMVYRRRDDEAEPLCRRALEISEQIYGPNHPKIATCLNNLATQVRRCN